VPNELATAGAAGRLRVRDVIARRDLTVVPIADGVVSAVVDAGDTKLFLLVPEQ
jgi:hypothetical protein